MRMVLFCLVTLFTCFANAIPTFNPQLNLKNEFGETHVFSPQAGSNWVGNFKAATVTLTAAQVIALNGTPITLIAAQSGMMIKVAAVEMVYTHGSAAFTVTASKHLELQYHSSAVQINSVSTTGFIDQTTGKTAMVIGGGSGGVGIGGEAVEITSDDSSMSSGTGSTVAVTVYYDLLKVL
jgi:hypothetical protein